VDQQAVLERPSVAGRLTLLAELLAEDEAVLRQRLALP
jgi:hypothetical protein